MTWPGLLPPLSAGTSGVSPSLLLDVLLGLLTVAVAFAGVRLTSRQVRSQAQAAIVAVDAAAYDRAKGIYEGAIGQLERENADVRQERDRARADLAQVAADRDRVRADNRLLVAQVVQLGGVWPPPPSPG